MSTRVQRWARAGFLILCIAAVSTSLLASSDQESKKEKKARGWLGVSIQDVTEEIAKKEKLKSEEGAYVTGVSDDSPADSAGLRRRDVIVEFAGKEIRDAEDLSSAVAKTHPGTKAAVVVMRSGEKKSLSVTVGRMKSSVTKIYSRSFPPRTFHMPPMPQIKVLVAHNGLGCKLSGLNEQLGEYFGAPNNEGVLVEEVEENGAGAKAGFKAGDVIIRAGKRSVDEPEDVQRELRKHEDGDKVEFEVLRKGARKTLTVVIEEPENDEGAWTVPHPGIDLPGFRFNLDGGLCVPERETIRTELEQMKRELRSKQYKLQDQIQRTLHWTMES